MHFGACIAVVSCSSPSATTHLGVRRACPWQRAGLGHVGRGGTRTRTGKSGCARAEQQQAAASLWATITVGLMCVKPTHNFFRWQKGLNFAQRSRQSHSPASSGRWDQTISKRSLFNHFWTLQQSRDVSVEQFSLRENPEVYATAVKAQHFQ